MRSIVMGLSVLVCLVAGAGAASAQDEEYPFEVGGVYTIIELTDFQARAFAPIGRGNNTVSGIGGRFAYNINKHFAIDAEGNFFPETHLLNEEFAQKMQGFIGLKAGIRKKRVGVFAKARPGVMWFGEFPTRGGCNNTSFGSVCGVSHEKDFAMDLGGVFEFYPTHRLILRADAGDTIIRYPEHVFATSPTNLVFSAATKHNFQLSFGIGWRF
ncbi:MAG TPA: outer membrane beta-barrel protein [Pyrinomonadaceae bacterium]|nr:outer membrane beta-barrel protein [Pyrinomonadaceae bacterium]